MEKEKAKTELILPHLKQGEELIGFFQAGYLPSWGWYFLIGPFVALGMRLYMVGVTDQGLHLHKLSFWGKPDVYNFFSYSEIAKLNLGSGIFQAPFRLLFSNGRKLTLKAQLKGVEKIAKLDEKTKQFLQTKNFS